MPLRREGTTARGGSPLDSGEGRIGTRGRVDTVNAALIVSANAGTNSPRAIKPRWRRRRSGRGGYAGEKIGGAIGARREQHPWPRPSTPAIISQTTARMSERSGPSRKPARMSGAPRAARFSRSPPNATGRERADFEKTGLDSAKAVNCCEQRWPDRAEGDHAERHLAGSGRTSQSRPG